MRIARASCVCAIVLSVACLGANAAEGIQESQPSASRAWSLRTFSFDLGHGPRSNTGHGEQSPSFLVAFDGVRLARGFDKLGGIGVGTAIYEVFASSSNANSDNPQATLTWSARGLPQSLLPAYVYIPIYQHTRYYPHPNARAAGLMTKSPLVVAFGGGSAWGMQHNYTHAGILALWSIGLGQSISGQGESPMCVGLQVGTFNVPEYSVNDVEIKNQGGFYAFLVFGYGGVWMPGD